MATRPPARLGLARLVAALRAGDLRPLLTRHGDLAVAAFVLASVAMLVVPLPALALDLLISLNLAVAVTLLLVTLYVRDALKVATFPTLLLLTTLFRVALEVSATRLILVKANAGQVIAAFGSFVVSGNLVAGVVVFAILTTVQYVVIAKGAARVAEVGARFALDAMPGKQLAIDAELRAGHLDHAQASARRAALERESQFFGSMDGAMKFVKGDAVAGIVVLLVNSIGGLAIGVLQKGMDVGHALRTYTLLSVGEGLVAQIPALVISTAAGILVTRVSSEDDGSHLGRDIGRQILAQPKALVLVALLLVGLAAVPGLPAAPFLVLATLVGMIGYRLLRQEPKTHADGAEGDRAKSAPAPLVAAIEVELSADLARALLPERGRSPLLHEAWPVLRERLFAETGIALPALVARAAPGVPAGGYVIKVQEIPAARGSVGPGADARADVVAELERVLRREAHRLVDVDLTQRLLDELARTQPVLVREVVPHPVSLVTLAEVLRRLAGEGISLRHLGEILSALARRPAGADDPAAATEHVRTALQRQLTFQHAADGTLAAHFLDATIEDTVRDGIRRDDGGDHLALPAELAQDIVDAVGRAVDGVARPVVVASADIRRHLRELLASERPEVVVLAYQELCPETRLEPRGHITLPPPPA